MDVLDTRTNHWASNVVLEIELPEETGRANGERRRAIEGSKVQVMGTPSENQLRISMQHILGS